jgi:Protein of unknown function (DUF3565)
MKSKIVDYYLDEHSDWVAKLACGHCQHVRHQPPFINRYWVISKLGREKMLGHKLLCKKCQQNVPKDYL